MFKFKASDLPEILTRWSARYSVFVRAEARTTRRCASGRAYPERVRFMEPDEYTNLIVAPKGFVLRRARGAVPLGRQREDLYRHQRAVFVILAGRRQDPVRSAALRHVRAGYMDRFFLGEHHDINYHLRRQHVFIVAVNCLEAGPECYCASMGTGPFAEITAHTEYGMQAGKGMTCF